MKEGCLKNVQKGFCVLIFLGSVGSGIALPLQNGGAESGDEVPWESQRTFAVESQRESAGTVTPYNGSYFFSMATEQGSFSSLSQTNSLSLGTQWLFLDGAIQTENLDSDDFGTAILSVFDATNALVASATNTFLSSLSLIWNRFEVALEVPSNGVSWRVDLTGTLVYGSYVNVFYDDIKLYESRSSILQKPPMAIPEGGIALEWFSGNSNLSYTVLCSTSLVKQVFAPAEPTNQWPISTTSWTNLSAPSAAFFKIEAE